MAATLPQMLWPSRRVVSGSAAEKAGDIAFLLSLVASGQMQVVVDGVYRLDNIVSAHKRVEVRGKAGTVIVNFGELR